MALTAQIGSRTFGDEWLRSEDSTFPCETREHLFTVYRMAIDIYFRVVCDVIHAAEAANHSEFHFLSGKADTARKLKMGAHERLIKHRADHGC